MIVPDLMLDKIDSFGTVIIFLVMILGSGCGDPWGSYGREIGIVDDVMVMIGFFCAFVAEMLFSQCLCVWVSVIWLGLLVPKLYSLY